MLSIYYVTSCTFTNYNFPLWTKSLNYTNKKLKDFIIVIDFKIQGCQLVKFIYLSTLRVLSVLELKPECLTEHNISIKFQ